MGKRTQWKPVVFAVKRFAVYIPWGKQSESGPGKTIENIDPEKSVWDHKGATIADLFSLRKDKTSIFVDQNYAKISDTATCG